MDLSITDSCSTLATGCIDDVDVWLQ